MTDLPGRVLAATDGSENATRAVRAAADLSNRAGAELHVVHVRKPLPVQSSLSRPAYFDRAFEEFADLYEEETGQLMRRQVFRAKAEGADVSDAHLREGRAAEEITGLARELAADLVVVGRRSVGPVERLVKGSVSERVVRLAACPTLVVRGEKAPGRRAGWSWATTFLRRLARPARWPPRSANSSGCPRSWCPRIVPQEITRPRYPRAP